MATNERTTVEAVEAELTAQWGRAFVRRATDGSAMVIGVLDDIEMQFVRVLPDGTRRDLTHERLTAESLDES